VSDSEAPRRTVFLVHGRDNEARASMEKLLRAFDLKVIPWRLAATWAGGGTPYTGDIVDVGVRRADAVVVLLTPDDVAHLRPEYVQDRDDRDEREPTGQPRMNVIFEAGMAMAIDRKKVILVEVGKVRRMTDIDGVNVIRLDDSPERRKDFAARLRAAGLAVDTDDDAWRDAGKFEKKPPPVRTSEPRASSSSSTGAKGEAYRAFWQLYLDRARQHETGSWTRARGTRDDNWLVHASREGEAYVVGFTGDSRLRAEYYFGRPTGAANLLRFRQFQARQSGIERLFGAPLSWEELPGRKACRIAAYRPGQVMNRAQYEEYVEWFLDTMARLRNAIEAEGPDY
jgi:hypothetical protein